jgi:hypothetical protein
MSAARRPAPRVDLSRYSRLPRRDSERWAERREQIAQDFPAVTADAHDWIGHEDAFVDLVRDIIKVGLPQRPAGPYREPTPDEARADWRRFIIAATGTAPAPAAPWLPTGIGNRPAPLRLGAIVGRLGTGMHF